MYCNEPEKEHASSYDCYFAALAVDAGTAVEQDRNPSAVQRYSVDQQAKLRTVNRSLTSRLPWLGL